MPDREHTLAAVDVGGTKIAAALVVAELPGPSGELPASPRLVRHAVTPTVVDSPETCLEAIAAAVAGVLDGGGAEAIGLGMPSRVDFARGRIVESVHLPLADLPLRDLLERRFGLPCVIDNDATAACIGEHLYGAGRSARDMLMLTLGTGVGGGIIAGGRAYRGHSGAAAELGHVVIDEDGPPCPGRCSNRGCLEVYASGRAMDAAAGDLARSAPDGAFGRASAGGEPVDGALLTRLALDGHAEARAALARIGEHLGVGITSLVNIFNPEVVVVGGAGAAAGELLLAPARAVLAVRGLRPQRDEVRVVTARFGPEAGVVGAAALALSELFGE